jgi:lipoprotein-releasing system permease protein
MAEGHIPQFGAGDTPSDSIIISGRTAAALKLKTGDRVYAYFFTNQLRARRYIVAGIFNTYMSDFDDNLVFADVRNVQGIAHWDKDIYSGAEVILPGFQDLNEIAMQVGRVVLSLTDSNGQYYANPTVREIYPQIFSWLTLLDTNVIAILILMICVACVTMVSGLLIIILERTQFIGIMKAMGATNSQLRHLFLYLSAMIVVRGIVIGNAIAFALLYLQKYTGIAKLDPANYYLNTVPVSFPWTQIAIVNISTLIICVLVLVIPSYLVSRIHPAKSIRFE